MGATVIYGPPGTGKTTKLVEQVNLLIQSGVNPNTICFLSFTRAAAREMAKRVDNENVNISTIHSLAYKVSNLNKNQLMDKSNYLQFAKLTGFVINGSNPEDQGNLTVGDQFLALYSLHENLLLDDSKRTFSLHGTNGSPKEFKFFVKKIKEFKEAYGVVDFIDMLKLALKLPPPGFDYFFIDEAQDLSPLQWCLINHWSSGCKYMFVAGDDDQAIYVWGGADPNGMNKFANKHNAKTVILNQSYRVPKSIHELANNVISNIKCRIEKEYLPKGHEGKIRKFDSPFLLPVPRHGEDILFLYRNHSLRQEFEQILIDNYVPYVVDSGKPGYFQSQLIRAVRLVIKIRENYQKPTFQPLTQTQQRLLSKFFPGHIKSIQKNDFDFTLNKHWTKYIIGPFEQIEYVKQIEKKMLLHAVPTIHLSTIHGSKGREAERVVLLNGLGGRSMDSHTINPDSEIRNFYVAITRSKNILDIVYGQNSLQYF